MCFNNEIRKSMISKRKALTKSEYVTKSSMICDKILKSKWYKSSSSIYLYCSINNEVNLDLLIENALLERKIISFPKVEGKEMRFYPVTSKNDLAPGYYNIPEPIITTPAPKADLIIVPGTAFTKSGKRLGYGGGFYDRFLAQYDVYSIGVCYDFQIVDDLQIQPHDKILNEVIFA